MRRSVAVASVATVRSALRATVSQGTVVRRTSHFNHVKEEARLVPRRALLYVPASSEKMLAKVPQIQADSVVIELEDGVALTAKAEARKNAVAALDNLVDAELCAFELGLRVNSVSSGLLEDDVKALARSKRLPDAFMVPKVDTPADLAAIFDVFKKHYGAERVTDTKTRLVLWIESARALLDMPRIVSSAIQLHQSTGFFKLDAVVFGSDDYCADIGATRSSVGDELVYARQRFVACCKAFQLQAIDAVFIDLKDTEGLERQSQEGRRWGFTGKQVIHPSQVPIVQSSFSPPSERVEWARSLADEYAEHQKHGKGAFSFRGQMIDRPLLLQAMNVLQLVELVENAQTPGK